MRNETQEEASDLRNLSPMSSNYEAEGSGDALVRCVLAPFYKSSPIFV
jgi:hypothetical protein